MTKRLTGTRSIMASADDVYRMLTSSGPASSPCVGVPGGRSAWWAFVGYRLHGWVYRETRANMPGEPRVA